MPFPQAIKAANKYFTTEIYLLCGFYIDRQCVRDFNHSVNN